MGLLIGLTLSSCLTTPQNNPDIDVPNFSIPAPERPVLVEIPKDTSGSIRALTTNLSMIDGYVRLLELYTESLRLYYEGIVQLLNQT
jgi:hypothetical protein